MSLAYHQLNSTPFKHERPCAQGLNSQAWYHIKTFPTGCLSDQAVGGGSLDGSMESPESRDRGPRMTGFTNTLICCRSHFLPSGQNLPFHTALDSPRAAPCANRICIKKHRSEANNDTYLQDSCASSYYLQESGEHVGLGRGPGRISGVDQAVK